ncbi:MAG: magnesium/cobalt transporter CorA [Myxococcales bacterium]|nr:magnesium/cobalt transporter CorA [Myxococcales bacterium]
MDEARDRNEPASLVERGRRLVRASADIPLEALEFLGLPLMRTRRRPPQGATPGEMVVPMDAPPPEIRYLHFARERLEEGLVADPKELARLIAQPDGVTWIDVAGFGDRGVLESIAAVLAIHPLAMADVVHVPQRPKAELHDDRLLVVTQMARVALSGEVDIEQVSFVLGPGWVASFQERPGDVFDPIRARIRTPATRIRESKADYLLYSLVDAVIDGFFPVVEALGGVIEELEEEVLQSTSPASLARIHATRRTLLTLHRLQWRQRDAVNSMLRDEDLPLSPAVKPYLRDAHDHAFQTLDAIETYRDMVVGLMDLHLSAASHRMNEVMKTLTIVATIFIPLTFLAGVYGMNFDHMPELHWRWGYPAAWLSMIGIGAGLVWWFRRRGWLGDGHRDADPR